MSMTPQQQKLLYCTIMVGGLLLFGLYLSKSYPWWLYPLPVFAVLYGLRGYWAHRTGGIPADE